jgi:N-acetylneuraminic acid mutarotase
MHRTNIPVAVMLLGAIGMAARLGIPQVQTTLKPLSKPVAKPRGVSAVNGAAVKVNGAADDGTWRTHAPLKQGAIFAGTVAGADDRIYVISGVTRLDGGELTAAVHVYYPVTDNWSEARPLPTARTEGGAALSPDGKIYVMGGRPAGGDSTNLVEAFDPKTNTWTRTRPMPTPREALSVVSAQGADGKVRLYAIGGRNGRHGRRIVRAGKTYLTDVSWNQLGTVEAYEPATDRWTTMAPMPTKRHALTATLGPDGRIYALGGTNNTITDMDVMEIYDPKTNTWQPGAPMPYGQECAASTFSQGPHGEVFVMGGWDTPEKIAVSTVAAYDPRARSWRLLPSVPTGRAGGGAVRFDGADGYVHLYFIGGAPKENCVEEYTFPLPADRPDNPVIKEGD